MQEDTFTKIRRVVLDIQMKKLPLEKVVIEYNCELPEENGISADNFLGVKARFNKDVELGSVKSVYSY